MKEINKNLKILEILFELSNGERIPINYEDIVVRAYEKYPNDFQLRGYPQYPDSSIIAKPLYGSLKKNGYVISGGKQFQLTELGIRIASEFRGKLVPGNVKLPRDLNKEIIRISNADGFKLFVNGKKDRLIDTDFYEFIGVTVSTPKNLFLGRLKVVKTAISKLNEIDKSNFAKNLREYMNFMLNKFNHEIP